MTKKVKVMKAAKVADEILRLATTLTDEDINKALRAIAHLEGTWGVLWGLGNIQRSAADVDIYQLKQKALLFLQELRKENKFYLVVAMFAVLEQRREKHEKDPGSA